MNPRWTKYVAGLGIGFTLAAAAWAVDTDLDGVDDILDVCCETPAQVLVDEQGRPLADFDLDCDVDMLDAAMFWESFTGPLPFQTACEGSGDGGDTEDQCLMGTHNCHDNANCTDTSNGFICTCSEGYSGNGVQCTDINECALNMCGLGGACTNFVGGYSCSCGPGYTNNNGHCTDNNECLDDGLCGDAGACVNQPGGYSCACNSGWANCDTQPDCEINLAQSSNTCSTALFAGQSCGDMAATPACTPTGFSSYSSISGRGSKWIQVRMDECWGCCSDLQHRYSLTVPAGTNYDLYVYSACGGALLDSSTNGMNQSESVIPTLEDDCSSKDNSTDVFIEIRNSGGSSCGSWQLTLESRE